jgi:hypothetical protein
MSPTTEKVRFSLNCTGGEAREIGGETEDQR